LLVLKKLAGVKMTKTTEQKLFLLVIVLLLAAFLFSLTVGRYKLDWFNILEVIKLRITDQSIPDHLTSDDIVFWSVRLPRLLMALFVGSALAVSGTVFQGLFRNPLVSPDILGVSAGASFGAGMAILIIGNSAFAIQVSAFAFGLVAVALAYQLARHCRTDTITVLVLAGVIVSALFTAGLSFLKYVADPYEELPALVFWTMGGFSTIAWKDVAMTVPVVLIGILILYLLRWKLDIMALGDEEALSLGVKVNNMRLIYIAIATLIVASSVATCGTIGWVGLVVPHMARLIIGPGHNHLLPFAAILGAAFMILMDTLARSISGGEIPIGIITSFIGAPFLGYLLWKQGKD
jgi:iron complex transport system permease protein